jgi:hypothetical protein
MFVVYRSGPRMKLSPEEKSLKTEEKSSSGNGIIKELPVWNTRQIMRILIHNQL